MPFLILNPLPGGRKFTTAKKARGYIDAGQAVRVGANGIRFLDTPEQFELSKSAATKMVSGGFYDHAVKTRTLRQREAKHLPFAGDISRLGIPA